MPNYKSPGIYIEEPQSGPRPIQGVSTSIAAFIGCTPDGKIRDLDGKPKENGKENGTITGPRLVTSWDQFCREFGKEVNGEFDPYDLTDPYMAYAVYGFFENGGSSCYIVRINQNDPESMWRATVPVPGDNGKVLFEITGTNTLENGTLTISAPDPALLPAEPAPEGDGDQPAGGDDESTSTAQTRNRRRNSTPTAPTPVDSASLAGLFTLNLKIGTETYTIPNVTLQSTPGKKTVAQGLEEVGLWFLQYNLVTQPTEANLTPEFHEHPFEVKTDQLALIEGNYTRRTGARGLQIAEDVTIICCPYLMAYYNAELSKITADEKVVKTKEALQVVAERKKTLKKTVRDLQNLLANLCENTKDRMVILDSPPDMDAQAVNDYRKDLVPSAYAAFYYPWIKVRKHGSSAEMIDIPPCGHVAGVWARTDTERGVHKAPANETVRGAIEPVMPLTRIDQGDLNFTGINCIRSFPNQGTLVYGARTLAAQAKAEWRYISVRRLFNFVEKSLERGMQWVVFEPNNHDLWARVTRDITAFLTGVWRDGALFGTSPAQAFYVKCDEALNPPESRNEGYLIVEIGLAPVKPAEFVVFRFKQWQESTE